MIFITNDIRWSYNICNLGSCVILKCIRSKSKLRIYQLNIEIEDRHLSLWTILSPFRCKNVLLIHKGTAVKEVTKLIDSVVIQAIGKKCGLSVFQLYIITDLRNLSISIIVEIVTIQCQGISLFHLHFIESFEGVVLLEEKSAVAIHIEAVMLECYISNQYLSIRFCRIWIFLYYIRMKQENLAFWSFCCPFLHRSLC